MNWAFLASAPSVTPDWLLEPVMGLVSESTGLYWSAEVQLALQNCLSESEHHVLTQEEAEEEAVLWANLN